MFLCLGLRAAVGVNHPSTTYVEGDVIVTFKPTANQADAQSALARHSLEFAKYFSHLSGDLGKPCGLIHQPKRTTTELIAELRRDPLVEQAETNYLRWVTAMPNDALYTNLWALHNQGQSVNGFPGTAGDDIRFVPAWNLARPTTNPVVVAVLDTGVDYTHPDIASNMWTNPGEIPNNGIDDDKNGYVDDYYGYDFVDGLPNPTDSGFHGTHLAGTIAAIGNNHIGVIGVNYQAKIMALKISNNGSNISSSAEIEGLSYATMMKKRGVNLVAINASFGGGGSTTAEESAIQAAGNAGIIFCAAAGNDSADNDATPVYPASYHLSNMIVVAASDQNDALASFSDYGANSVDLAAPGVNILSLLPAGQAGLNSQVQQGTNTFSANAMTYSGTTTGLTARVYFCGLGYSTNFPAAVRNNIALIERGTLNFSVKVANAMTAGARAAIIYNNAVGNYNGTLGSANNWIPAISLSQADGLSVRTNQMATVINATNPADIYQYLDGTSMATPHVSGAVAFAAQNFPNETVVQRVQRILANVDKVSGLTGLVQTGGRLNLQRIVDTDQNGLPDWWELQYFGHLMGANTNADLNHNGLSILADWLAGLNPTNPASSLSLNLVIVSPTHSLELKWPSVAGKAYQLESTTNLFGSPFVPFLTNLAATAPTNYITDTNPPPGPVRFYRVGVVPQ